MSAPSDVRFAKLRDVANALYDAADRALDAAQIVHEQAYRAADALLNDAHDEREATP